jgi:hypothetical protein
MADDSFYFLEIQNLLREVVKELKLLNAKIPNN